MTHHSHKHPAKAADRNVRVTQAQFHTIQTREQACTEPGAPMSRAFLRDAGINVFRCAERQVDMLEYDGIQAAKKSGFGWSSALALH
jgi:hypothetical protein